MNKIHPRKSNDYFGSDLRYSKQNSGKLFNKKGVRASRGNSLRNKIANRVVQRYESRFYNFLYKFI